jgi:hypothetical protein
MTDKKEKIRWGAERRLEFIEFRVFWDGGVNRSHLTEEFGVSVPQASADLTDYQHNAPGNLIYDSSQKMYIATQAFSPIYLKPNADRYLAQLRVISDGIVDKSSTWMDYLPNCDALSIPMKRVAPLVLRDLIDAIRLRKSVLIRYQSMSTAHPDPMLRRITPHAFAFDGLRWHTRAFCHIDSRFKDFVLSRCYGVGIQEAPGAQSKDDFDWHSTVSVTLKPNPQLSPTQQAAVALDYGMADGKLVLSIRRSLLFYFNKRLRLDFLKYDTDPQQNPLIVENKEELDEALKTNRATNS